MPEDVPWVRIVFVGPSGVELAAWDIGGPGRPDLAVVDALSRWQLSARRGGGSVLLVETSADLVDLLDLVGLRREMVGQPECREEMRGVEEGVEGGDPIT
ncbi:MAG: hypothetical protein ACRDU0_05250 [Mycobacterium sp.]